MSRPSWCRARRRPQLERVLFALAGTVTLVERGFGLRSKVPGGGW